MLNPGTLLASRYEVLSIVGKGGMGSVYLAQATVLGNKRVALKELDLAGLYGERLTQAVEQFRKEASLLANLQHPNLVEVTDFFSHEEKHYLVMSYVDGENLQQKLRARNRPFTWEEVEPWAQSLVEVLSYLHGQKPAILFRDLKPSNIMLAHSGRLHLIDFGIARTARVEEKTCTFLRGTGTRGFSPIEQFGFGESTDTRSDIYSLGATLYYLLTGTIPPDAIERVSNKKVMIPPSELREGLPLELDSILAKAMEVSACDRYSSLEEFSRDLRRMSLVKRSLVQSPETLPSDDEPTERFETSSPPRRKTRLSFSAVLLASSLVLVGMNGLASSQPTEPPTLASRSVAGTEAPERLGSVLSKEPNSPLEEESGELHIDWPEQSQTGLPYKKNEENLGQKKSEPSPQKVARKLTKNPILDLSENYPTAPKATLPSTRIPQEQVQKKSPETLTEPEVMAAEVTVSELSSKGEQSPLAQATHIESPKATSARGYYSSKRDLAINTFPVFGSPVASREAGSGGPGGGHFRPVH